MLNTFETALLRYLKPEELALIQKQRIAVAGAGGLGSNAAVMLARTGFKFFEIIDRDNIEASNLNRQDYTFADIGRPKVEALKERLLGINPDIVVKTWHETWNETSAQHCFQGCGILIEAFDQAEWKARLCDYYSAKGLLIVSGNGMAGLDVKTPMTVKKMGNIYLAGDLTTSITDGHPPLAPRVVQCAAKMAETVLKLALGLTP
jgi:sulfur carrier protein ThiS adenylyltransferase